MKISASILNIRDPKQEEVKKLCSLDIDYLHLDVMDGIFVENKTWGYEEYKDIIKFAEKNILMNLKILNQNF